jgi:hypothetical protein
MKKFSEEIFLYSLLHRPEDAKRFSAILKSEWMETIVYRPILQEIYDQTEKLGTSPTLGVLRHALASRDKAQYDARWSDALDKIEKLDPLPDHADMLYHLNKAKDAAVCWSIKELTDSEAFQGMQETMDGDGYLEVIENWMQQFALRGEDVEATLRESTEQLKQRRTWIKTATRIPCGIKVVDDLCGGGLRAPGLGIIMAPTGAGKSNCLIIIGDRIARQDAEKRVLFITNELSVFQVTERMLASISGADLNLIMEEPVVGLKGIDRHWQVGLGERVRFWEVSREIDVHDIQATVAKYVHLYGWNPDVIVIDFMERMKPTLSGLRRESTWTWFGAIAKDLMWSAKRNDWLIWTACQTNRGGLHAKVQDMSHAQGSIQHFQEATAVIGMHEVEGTEHPKEGYRVIEFTALKLRENQKPSAPFMVGANFAKMHIEDKPIELQDCIMEPEAEPVEKEDKQTPAEKQKARQRRNGQAK